VGAVALGRRSSSRISETDRMEGRLMSARKTFVIGLSLAAGLVAAPASAYEEWCRISYNEYIGDTYVRDVIVTKVDDQNVEVSIDFVAPECTDGVSHLAHSISARVTFKDGSWLYTGDLETFGITPAYHTTGFPLSAGCANAEVEVTEECRIIDF
jgi:hypothetical protein